jgi:hypothetical protein
MVPYFGDYAANATVYIPINTFDSNDPAASVTVTNLVNTDVHIHKDGGTTQRNNAAGITMTVDFDSITGNHLLIIDTSDNTVADFWEAGHEYQVRIEGATVDGGTINAWVGSFSIERAGGALALIKSATYGLSALKTLLDTTGIKVASFADNAITAASINADAITNAKIADNAIAAENLAADCITNAKIADNAITSAKINDNAITAGKINSGAITSAKFAAGAIDATAIATNAIGSDELADAAASKIGTAVWATATRQLTNTQSFNLTGNITGNLSGSVGSVTGAVGSVTGNVGGNVAGSVASVTGAVGSVTGAVGSVTADVTVGTNKDKTGYSLSTSPPTATAIRQEIEGANYMLAAIKGIVDKVDTMLEEGEDEDYVFTEASLVNAPAGGNGGAGFTVQDIVDGILDEALEDHDIAGSVGAGIAAAGSAGDPWATLIPGSYGDGTAGKIVGGYLDAAISTRLATAGYTAPPTPAQIWSADTRQLTSAQSFNLTGNITGNLSGSVGSVTGAVGSVTGAVGSVTGGVTVTTNNDKTGYSLASAPPSATAIREEMDANSTRLSGLVTELGKVPKSDSNVTWNNTALGSIQTKCGDALAAYDPPTNAEMEARTIASANYATASNLSTTDGKIDSIKTKTDSLTFTKSGEVDSNIKSINGTTVTGDGGVTPWGP